MDMVALMGKIYKKIMFIKMKIPLLNRIVDLVVVRRVELVEKMAIQLHIKMDAEIGK